MICDVGGSRGASRSETDVVEVVLSQRDNKAGSTLNLIRTAPISKNKKGEFQAPLEFYSC